ncbi:uncharacterized protein CTRU02_214889 [Colletotrichum truncatum]|uniref:Uncharacterized protein n=1 Tax=Colletotrichum truncatum TaxID=5467 RepID=A0ACC3YDY2_COLTU
MQPLTVTSPLPGCYSPRERVSATLTGASVQRCTGLCLGATKLY